MPENIVELVTPIAVTTETMSYSNKVYLSSKSKFPSNKNYLFLKGYILSYELSQEIPLGKIGMSKKFRQFLILSKIDQISIRLYDRQPNDTNATLLHISIQMLIPPNQRTQIDDLQLTKQFIKTYNDYYISLDQIFVMNYNNDPYCITIDKIIGNQYKMYINSQTKIISSVKGEQKISLKSTKNIKKNIFSVDFTLNSLGIGGLDQQLTNLFRRAFASRRLPHSIIEKFGIKHVKGLLLYGPPGTGKTLIARQLSKSLKAKSLQIVNGPQIFSKYVGESEENIRKLFQPARQDQKKHGEESPIHVIVFDEIDAICKQRGSGGSEGGGSRDAVVNQLLTNLDGVEALNNVIVIGMTNRKDLLDEAVLRPGRLEVHIQIGIPNEKGRKQIFDIHTKKLRDENLMQKKVNIDELAKICKNYTGAQIEAVVKNASSFAMTKGNNLNDFSKQLKLNQDTKVTKEDFQKAIIQVPPAFGIDQQNFEVYQRKSLIDWGKGYKNILKICDRVGKNCINGISQITSLLLYGPSGTGKTSIASQYSKTSQFSFVKMITPDKYIGINAYGKINSMNKIFNDAYKSKTSLIVIDNIQRLIQYVQTGPDFNNHIMQAIITLIQKIPQDPQCKLMIIGTTSNYNALDLLDINKVFNFKLKIDNLNQQQCNKVLQYNLGISNVSIKKLSQFIDIVQDQPKSIWINIWNKFI